jgi:DNA-binding GntR family transcriptional regulator
MRNEESPIYAQIALDIALRIVRGELKENSKVYGRSVMSSEYGVSPETIRRAFKLLEDTDIVEIKQNSGVMVVSSENARKYVERFGSKTRCAPCKKSWTSWSAA